MYIIYSHTYIRIYIWTSYIQEAMHAVRLELTHAKKDYDRARALNQELQACMHVCMHVCIHVCICVCVYVSMYVYRI